MKIRIMGTEAEITAAMEYFRQFLGTYVTSISEPYKNRGESCLYRLYIDTTDKPITEATRSDVMAQITKKKGSHYE